MNKLELKQVSPYLPYRLNWQASKNQFDFGKTEILEMVGVNNDKGLDIDFLFKDDLVFLSSLRPIKAILRPLSDLTKEIEQNGKKFVPAQILHRIGSEGLLDPFDSQYRRYKGKYNINEFEDAGYNVLRVSTQDKKYGVIEISYAIEDTDGVSFYYSRNQNEKYIAGGCLEQYQLYQRLFEWHFDIFGLIEKKLAVDINTIK